MKRKLLILALGLAFLVAITWLGTFVTSYSVPRSTPQVQTTQIGSYMVTLRVDPNPPSINQPASLSIQIQQLSSHQPVDNLQVSVNGVMEEMDMNTPSIPARGQGAGTYVASVPLSMSGSWQIQVLISTPGQPVWNALFTVATQ